MAIDHRDEKAIPDRYKLLKRLGSGAAGVVYKAQDTVLTRTVAIKILHTGHSERSYLRFHKEAKVVSKLSHESILSVLDFGQTEDNRAYLVMEYLEGESLDSLLERREYLPLPEAYPVFMQIAEGLQHAHAKGVLHRDVKPSNVILMRDSSDNLQVKLIDFGLAKEQSDEQRLTKTGVGVGSPRFVSPEQAQNEEVSEASDVYSFGCLLFAVLTGRPPFEGSSSADTIMMQISSTPPSLGELNEREVFPQALEELARACLVKRSADRIGSFTQVVDRLEQIQELLEPEEQILDLHITDPPNGTKLSIKGVIAITFLLLLISVFSYVSLSNLFLDDGSSTPEPDVHVTSVQDDFTQADFLGKKLLEQEIEHIRSGKSAGDIDLGRAGAVDEDLEQLTSLPLRKIKMSGCKVTASGLATIAKIQTVEIIIASYVPITADGIKQLSRLPRLKQLGLKGTGVDDLSLKMLGSFPSLRSLSLGQNPGITGATLEELCRLSSLQKLSLRKTKLIAKNLEKLDCHKSPFVLDLSNNDLRDSDLRHLMGINLHYLNISNNPITDDGLETLSALPKLSGIFCKSTRITSSGIKKFERQKGDCKVKLEDWNDGFAEGGVGLILDWPKVGR